MVNRLKRGDLILVILPSHQPKGREQEGRRPAIVVGIPQGEVRYPVLLIAPLTTQTGDWVQKNTSLYPGLEAGVGGFSQASVVLVDQIRAIDVRRVVAYLGSLTTKEYKPIQNALKQLLEI